MTLSDERKQALIEEHRDINTSYEWWDCVYDDFEEDMEKVGIKVDAMHFSGFWSQGDGASFTGYMRSKPFFEHHKLADSYPWIAKLIEMGGDFTLRIERNSYSHYVHENTVSSTLTFAGMFRHTLPNDGVRAAVIEQWDELLDAEYEGIAQAATDIIRDYCRDLYRRLREEYEYLTSDEAVWDAIVANDLDEVDEDEKETV